MPYAGMKHKLGWRTFCFFSNRAAAFLHLVKLNKALADAEMTIKLNPQWEKVTDFIPLYCLS